MNTQFRKWYILSMVATMIYMIIALISLIYDFGYIFNIIKNADVVDSKLILKVFTETHIFHVGVILIVMHGFSTYLKSRISPSLKGAFSPTLLSMIFYLFLMTCFHIEGYLTLDYFFASIVILMMFAIATFKSWNKELQDLKEIKDSGVSVFDDLKENQKTEINYQAEEKQVDSINPQITRLNNQILTKEFIEKMYKDRANIFTRPISFLTNDLIFSLVVFSSPNEKVRSRLKLISRIGMFLRCMFIFQLSSVIMFYFKGGHSIEFAVSNLTAPLFWFMALIVCQFHYSATMMMYVSEDRFKNKLFVRKGLFYFALIGTLLCSFAQPTLLILGMSFFYVLTAYHLIRSLETQFSPELNKIFAEIKQDNDK